MTSNQDNKQKKLDIPMTGIEGMNQLSLDANKMFYIAQEGLLLPYSPKDPLWQKLQMNSRCDSPESILSRWMYRESDVEDFKKHNKDWLETIKSRSVSTEDKEVKCVHPGESTEPENLIRALQVSYVSDTEIRIRGGGKNAKIYEMKDLGFSKERRTFFQLEINDDHLYRDPEYSRDQCIQA